MTTTHALEQVTANHDDRRRPMAPLLLTIPEAAAVLAVGRTTIYELISDGQLAAVHIGRSCRVPADAIREFVDAKRAL